MLPVLRKYNFKIHAFKVCDVSMRIRKNKPSKNTLFRRLFCQRVIPHIKFQDPISNRSSLYASVTDARTDPRTGSNQYAPSTSSKLGA